MHFFRKHLGRILKQQWIWAYCSWKLPCIIHPLRTLTTYRDDFSPSCGEHASQALPRLPFTEGRYTASRQPLQLQTGVPALPLFSLSLYLPSLFLPLVLAAKKVQQLVGGLRGEVRALPGEHERPLCTCWMMAPWPQPTSSEHVKIH